jgi:ATP-dependent helicase HrpA
MPQTASAELAYNRLSKHPLIPSLSTGNLGVTASYKEDMLFLIFYSVFIAGKKIRTQAVFEQNLREYKPELMIVANDAGKLVLEIMAYYGDIKKSIERTLKITDPLAKEINEQLDLLVYVGFIRNTPYQSLKAMPRYLKAIQYRLDKYDNNQQKIQEVSRYSNRFWTEIEKKAKKDFIIPEQDDFRWALEEYRVSLFAQQLKTAYPISAKRMEKLWDNGH